MCEMSVPSYITKQLLEDALKSFFKTKSVDIKSFDSEPAVPVGDSYASCLYRVLVSYTIEDDDSNEKDQIKSISTLIKAQPTETGSADDIQDAWMMFPNEIKMFGDTLKRLHKILGEGESLSSRCLLSMKDQHPLLVLEDLKPKGFQMASRQNGLDLDHCNLVMKKIAIFHAASVIMIGKEPSTKDFYEGKGIYFECTMVRDWVRKGIGELIEVAKKSSRTEKYARKLESLGEVLIDRGLAASKKDPNEFNVLNHGDCWTNNILFSYNNNGEVEDIRFVDFQLVTYKSPVIDLHYFLATSPSVDVHENHILYTDTLVNTYHTNLISELQRLNYNTENVPTLEEFKITFEKRAAYGLISAVTVLPLVRASTRADATFRNFLEDDSVDGFRYHCFNNDRFKNMIFGQLEYYDGLGILDP